MKSRPLTFSILFLLIQFPSYLLAKIDETDFMPGTSCGGIICLNGGLCSELIFSHDPNEEIRAEITGSLLSKCVCPKGFSGITCNLRTNACPATISQKHKNANGAPRKCRYGGLCIETDDNTFECHCDAAYDLSNFAGQMCENPATEYCDIQNRKDGRKKFCTNGGSCRANIISLRDSIVNDQGDNSLLCICPAEFEGGHCEYLKGTKPSIEILNDSKEPNPNFELLSETATTKLESKGASLGEIYTLTTFFIIVSATFIVILIERKKKLKMKEAGQVETTGMLWTPDGLIVNTKGMSPQNVQEYPVPPSEKSVKNQGLKFQYEEDEAEFI